MFTCTVSKMTFSVHEHNLALAERPFFSLLVEMDKRRAFIWTPWEPCAVNKLKHVVYLIGYIL
jgi:hypothetical protein